MKFNRIAEKGAIVFPSVAPVLRETKTPLIMNSSSVSLEDKSSSQLFILSVNISMSIVVLTFLCHLVSLLTLFRTAMRRKIFTPFMINISIISLVLAACGYSVTLGTNLKIETKNDTREAFLCSWVAYVGVLCKYAYSSTLCAMNIVSKVAADRCSRNEAQPMSVRSNVILFMALWVYPLCMSGIPFLVGNLFRLSASELKCQLHWPSKETSHNFYNSFAGIAMFLLPMVLSFTTQYILSRTWKRTHYIESATIIQRLEYRRKLNRMVIALTVYFFLSHLPYHVTNFIAMATERYILTPKTAFILELVEQSNILCPPLAYLFLNKRYRIALKQMITGTGARRRRVENHAARRNRTDRVPNRLQEWQRRRVRFANKVEPFAGPSGTNPAAGNTSNAGDSVSNNLTPSTFDESTPPVADFTSNEKANLTRTTSGDSQRNQPAQNNFRNTEPSGSRQIHNET